jgi:translation initiation factor IF-3
MKPYCASTPRSLAAAPAAPKVMMNQDIKFPKVRMVYVDEAGSSKSSVVTREEALNFAKGLKMDLVLSKHFDSFVFLY